MGQASHSQSSFLSGEWSQTVQGRFDRPDYKDGLSTCLNWIPLPQGALTRRPGTNLLSFTRKGLPARLLDFDIADNFPYTMEFTDSSLRFFSGSALVLNNDTQAVSAISTANPAVITVPAAWATGLIIVFSALGTNNPQLQNRLFTVTNISGTTFSIADYITGATINGSTLGTFVSGNATSVQSLATPYTTGSWANIVSVQAEDQAVLLNGTQPQVLTMDIPPTTQSSAQFSILPSNFEDGPYLDPFVGSQVTYSAQSGNITLTFSYAAYSSSVSYSIGQYVLSSGKGYVSLVNANLGNTPASSPTYWAQVNGGAPVGPNGFTSADIGRHIRLFNEPPLYASGSTYAAGAVVTYNGAYYSSLAGSNTGNQPDISTTDWALVSGAGYALWTWGRITAVSGSGLIASVTPIGSMTNDGGLSAAFDGNPAKNFASSAVSATTTVSAYPAFDASGNYGSGTYVYYSGNFYSLTHTYEQWVSYAVYPAGSYVAYLGTYYYALYTSEKYGIFYVPGETGGVWDPLGSVVPTNGNMWSTATAATACVVDTFVGNDFGGTKIQQATLVPSNDIGFANNSFTTLVINLRGSASSPAGVPSAGTLLGTTTLTANQTSAVTLVSSNQSTSWNYLWFELVATQTVPVPTNGTGSFAMALSAAQAEFYAPNVANGSVVTLQLAGPSLLYTTGTIVYTWQAGAYSNPTSWPTCGCFEGGRLWLGGAIDNRFDASNSDDIFNFAPTGPDGTVGDSNAISFTLNSKGVNQIRWMEPDPQGILCGTQLQEWLIFATTLNSPLTPSTTDARPVTKLGCAAIPPVRAEHTLVFVQKKLRKIVEYFADVFSGKFTAPDLTEKCRHLTVGNLAEVKYQQEITPVIWARCSDGSFFGESYRRDTLMTSQGPTFIGAHRHTLGSGRLVTSISVGASEGGNLEALSMVTQDTNTSLYYVETLGDIFEETDTLTSTRNSFLDAGITPSSYSVANSTLTINGLWPHNGFTVQAVVGGLDAGQVVTTTTNGVTTSVITDFVVSNGSIAIPLDDGSGTSASGQLTTTYVNSFVTCPITVGFTYNSDAQLLRPVAPQETGARNGTALTDLKKHGIVGLLLNNTQGLYWGTDFAKLRLANFKSLGGVPYLLSQLFSGIFRDTIENIWSYNSQICWRVSRPYPATIVAVEGNIEVSEKN